MQNMTQTQEQGDLTNTKEVRESALPNKRSKSSSPDNLSADNSDKDSLQCAQKRRAVHKEVCNDAYDVGDESSKGLVCQPATQGEEVESQNESNNPQSPSESLRTSDYMRSSLDANDERAERFVTVANSTFDPIAVRRELARMIIMHEYPLSVVEHIGFKDFLQKINPSFQMVSQKTVENDIMKIFRFEKCIAIGELNDDNDHGRVAITTKMWTSSDGNRRFLAVTGHIIEEEMKRHSSYIMRFANVPFPCTNKSIAKVILGCCSEFTLKKQLSTITVDSYTSDDKLIDILERKLSGNKFVFGGKLLRLPCFAHTLSLMVQDGFDVIRHVIEKIRASILLWTSSPQREKAFEKATRELGVSTTAKLVLDHEFNWGSTYIMLKESFNFEGVFFHLREQESCPSKEEWDLAREVCNRLKVLYDQTETLKDAPSCSFLISICIIKLELLLWLNCEVPEIKEMASKMVEKFDKYWFAARDFLGLASVFHPRYLFVPLKYFFPKIYGDEEGEGEIERIRQMFSDLFIEYKRSQPVEEIDYEDLRSRLSCMDYAYELYCIEKKKQEPELRELELYLEARDGRDRSDFDIFSWWEAEKRRFPILYKMAKDILSIPIFSVNSENAFDVGDSVLGENHSRLHPTMVETLLCTRSWARNRKRSESAGSSSALNLQYSLGTIHDDPKIEHGNALKAKTAEEGAEPLKPPQ